MSQDVLAEGTAISLAGGLARRSRNPLLKRNNSTPESSVLDPPFKKVIGVCAMDKKARSKPMEEILQRITSFNEFEVVVFGDQVILNEPVENWPECDCLLSWHSDGFPLDKAKAYVALRHPFCVNDVMQQDILLDRRKVYAVLKTSGIPVPNHIVVDRDSTSPDSVVGIDAHGRPILADPPGFVEDHDYVEMNGVRIMKPFVEKPVDGENHNLYIYYPHSHGGGVKRLFRKIANKSADYDPNHPGNVRRDGSYIYEEFLTTGGTDVKVYTVGPRYAHAEARKSPVVDGRVQRTADGKEMRHPVVLSPQEKEISRMVCLAFGQKVCGFDLLRSEKGKSYVCDVNGWSFVKNSPKYYDDASGILRSMILSALAPHRVMNLPKLLPGPIHSVKEEGEHDFGMMTGLHKASFDEPGIKNVASLQDLSIGLSGPQAGASEELRCVLAVIRHGDRTPKQKIKIKVTQPAMLALFDKHRNTKGDQAKLKSPLQLQELLDVVRGVLASVDIMLASISSDEGQEGQQEVEGGCDEQADLTGPGSPGACGELKNRESLEEFKGKMTIVRTVLEQGGGQFSGVNRKVQLKPIRWRQAEVKAHPQAEPPAAAPTQGAGDVPQTAPVLTFKPSASVASDMSRATSGMGALSAALSGSGGKLAAAGGGLPLLEEALLVVKWGGVLTHAGRQQAKDLGTAFRASMYPRHGPAGGGLLRLHSTYRHDLKIYSSDEGRVQVSAAAFTKGLLDLEGNSLTPILVSLVNKDASMLEAFGKGASEEMQACKHLLQVQLTHDVTKGSRPPITLHHRVSTPATASPSPPFSPATSRPLIGTLSRSFAAPQGSSLVWDAPGARVPSSHDVNKHVAFEEVVEPNGVMMPERVLGPSPSCNSLGASGLMSTPSYNGEASVDEGEVAKQLMHMPEDPLSLLHSIKRLIDQLVEHIQELCQQEQQKPQQGTYKLYSSHNQAPEEWELIARQPCGGEQLVLLLDRWRKLADAIYNEKKKKFDISKVPDVYDSVKHDAIHNAHLGLPLADLYYAAKALADVVIPHEYGIDPHSKLSIGSKIAKELVGKLLADMSNMKLESESTAFEGDDALCGTGDEVIGGDTMALEFGLTSLEDDRMRNRHGALSSVINPTPIPDASGGGGGVPDGEQQQQEGEGGEGEEEGEPGDDEVDDRARHRLCPTYAHDINSPLRHVRTRIYFTSESHIHSLINVLRFCHLKPGYRGSPLVSEAAQRMLDRTPECDYLTQIVFRMYENMAVPVGDDARFRVELSFSPGAAWNPLTHTPPNHVLPAVPLEHINAGEAGAAQSFAEVEALLTPFSVYRSVCAPYALSVALKAPSNPTSRKASTAAVDALAGMIQEPAPYLPNPLLTPQNIAALSTQPSRLSGSSNGALSTLGPGKPGSVATMTVVSEAQQSGLADDSTASKDGSVGAGGSGITGLPYGYRLASTPLPALSKEALDQLVSNTPSGLSGKSAC